MRILAFLLLAISLHGATLTSPSLTWAAVSTTVSNAHHGDTVMLPAGSNYWNEGSWVPGIGGSLASIQMTKQVMVRGAGMGVTIISRGTNQARLFQFGEAGQNAVSIGRSNVWGLQDITLHGGTMADMSVAIGGAVTSTNRNFLIKNVAFRDVSINSATTARGISLYGRCEGVIAGCYFRCPSNHSGQGIAINGFQRAPLSQMTNNANCTFDFGTHMGSITNTVYIENNVFDFGYDNDAAIELYNDAQVCARFNYITNTSCGVHESGLTTRTASVWEYYGNIHSCANPTNFGVVNWLSIRSGYGVVFSNMLIMGGSQGIDYLSRLTQYRASGTNVYTNGIGQGYPQGAVTGTNLLDGRYGPQNDGSGFVLGYPAFDMPGWGDPTIWTGTNGTMTFHGCFSWSNTYNLTNSCGFAAKDFGNDNAGLLGWNSVRVPTNPELVLTNREFFNYTPKPGYTPLSFPHPLVLAGSITNTVNVSGTARVGTITVP